MSVNISRLDLLDDDLPGYIDVVLARHGVAPERLTLEITETSDRPGPDARSQQHRAPARSRACGSRSTTSASATRRCPSSSSFPSTSSRSTSPSCSRWASTRRARAVITRHGRAGAGARPHGRRRGDRERAEPAVRRGARRRRRPGLLRRLPVHVGPARRAPGPPARSRAPSGVGARAVARLRLGQDPRSAPSALGPPGANDPDPSAPRVTTGGSGAAGRGQRVASGGASP